jgi:ABC-type cobalamin/Fe3+-siderophores transport system ATPase subunit
MITEVYIDGYRSLSKLTVPIKPGLNIFVGPNGGGKTNILSLFELISRLVERPVDEAVSSHGGVGRVFKRHADGSYSDTLECRIRGNITTRGTSGKRHQTWYTWEFRISASSDYDEIQYSDQKLYIDFQSEPTRPQSSDLILNIQNDEEDRGITIEKCIITRLQPFFRSLWFNDSSEYINLLTANQIMRRVSRGMNAKKESVFLSANSRSPVFRQIISDISGGEIFNIVPEICKQPEDSARPPIIEKNGSGLASTLHRIMQSKAIGPPRQFRPNFFNASRGGRLHHDVKILDKIQSYVRLVNDSVIGIATRKNAFDNKISVVVKISGAEGETEFPLSYCSDGMVKWISLITKLIVTPSGFSIEEPENFLHPNIQKEFLKIVRNEAEAGNRSRFTLMTTHSESLLNEASPEEVILVWMDAGFTNARRVANSEELVDEINRTGFGLGYYYTTGALADG